MSLDIPEHVPPTAEEREREKTIRTGFHGTTAANAQSIIRDGFRPSNGGMLGAGVYWSDDIQKTRGYGDGTVLKLSIRPGSEAISFARALPRTI